MTTRALTIGVAILVLAGLAYFVSMSGKSALSETNSTQNSSLSSTQTSTSDPAMVGTWKSNEDAKFTREFKADGTIVDRYEGDASATVSGTYSTVDPAAEAAIGVPVENLLGMSVIKVTWPEGDMYFSINSMTDTDLKMTFLGGRGNLLTFTKVQ